MTARRLTQTYSVPLGSFEEADFPFPSPRKVFALVTVPTFGCFSRRYEPSVFFSFLSPRISLQLKDLFFSVSADAKSVMIIREVYQGLSVE